ncbi:putative aminoglycoside N(3')-acetyltransferase [Methylotuvimicrobium alcaliphilum 20Z]|uniref:Aminoglycoside N(3)-acetyltransferase n=2 Tax=Methylotuvimicrobium alcaliphilum TaxID=271065 RepID=G4SYV0_META2|nr:putative aminoglycoside N(3')-acetyltransferase [Methylotuvimicrobium alcaliphilum 20Z]
MSYKKEDLCNALNKLGLETGDCLMVHSSWLPLNGFKGRPVDMVSALKDVAGQSGILIMPTLTYQNKSSRDFLLSSTPMDVTRSPSMMGLLSEVFRRGKDVTRSLSPTHPLAVWGDKRDEFVQGHESCLVPFGVGSPFEKLLQCNGKILTIDAPFATITFTHYLEDRIASFLPFPLYDPSPMTGQVIDYDKKLLEVQVNVISEIANSARCEQRLVDRLNRCGAMKHKRIGNTHLMLIECKTMADCVDDMVKEGEVFFDLSCER